MPRNRRATAPEDKRQELISAAARLFVEVGYASASTAAIARAAGVTPNTLYWYFTDKDELLVAVADSFATTLFAELAEASNRPLAQQLVLIVERLRPFRDVVATIHARVRLSSAVAEWHHGFHRRVEAVFEAQLPTVADAARREAAAAVATYAIEGVITHQLDDAATAAICALVAEQLSVGASTKSRARSAAQL